MSALDFVPIAPGRLQARTVERQSRLVLEPPVGASVASVDLKPPKGMTTALEAAGGRWTVRSVEAIRRHRKAHLSVRDGNGAEVATVWFEGMRERFELGSETLVWESPTLFPFRSNHRIEGLFVARPAPLSFLGGWWIWRKPFTVEVSPALAARPDASLILPLAAWRTWLQVSTPG